MPPKVDKSTQRNVECSSNCGIWFSVWIPDGKVEVIKSTGYLCGYCNFSKFKRFDQIMKNLQQIQLDITAITKDLQRNSNLGSRRKPLEEKDHTMSEMNSAILLSNVENEKKKQQEKECNVIIRGLKKVPKHEAEGNVNDIFSFLEVDTVLVKINTTGTTNELNLQLLLVILPNPKVKWNSFGKLRSYEMTMDSMVFISINT